MLARTLNQKKFGKSKPFKKKKKKQKAFLSLSSPIGSNYNSKKKGKA